MMNSRHPLSIMFIKTDLYLQNNWNHIRKRYIQIQTYVLGIPSLGYIRPTSKLREETSKYFLKIQKNILGYYET